MTVLRVINQILVMKICLVDIKGFLVWVCLGVSLALTGCSDSKSPLSKDTFVWKINPDDARPMDLSLLIDSIWLVPLETNDSCLIKKIHQLDYKFGKFYVGNDVVDVQVYAHDGSFLYGTAPYVGGGPNDYTSAMSFCALAGDTLEVYDAMALKMRYFVPSQGFVSSLKLPHDVLPSGLHAWLNGDTCVFESGFPKVLKLYSKSKGKVIDFFEDKRLKQLFLKTSDALYEVDGKICFSPTYPSNELYLLTRNAEKKLVLLLDFGEHNFSLEGIPEGLSSNYYYAYMEEHPEYVYPYQKFISKGRYLAFFQYKSNFYVAYKKGKKDETILLKNKIRSHGQLMQPHHVGDGKLFYASEPAYLPYVVDTALMSREDINRMERMDEMDNPVIIVYRMK